MTPTILAALLVSGGAPEMTAEGVPPGIQSTYAKILETHVKNGQVDYKGIAKTQGPALDSYLSAVASAELPSNRNARLGFLIDAYNALVIKSVLRHGRPRSVLDVKGFFNEETHTVAGRKVTLDALEKKVLNPYAKDPRTHFVLVCGAVGCPVLESKPFFGSNVAQRMERATKRYLRSPHGSMVSGKQLLLSKIFDWYAGDFGGADGVKAFVVPRLSDEAKSQVGESPSVGFIDYNWTLNQK